MAEEGWRSQSNFVITSRKLTRYSSGFAWTPSSRVPTVPPRVDSVWYIAGSGNTGNYLNVTAWTASTAKAAGAFVRQVSFTVTTYGTDRCFVALNAGTTKSGTQPTWDTTRGGKTLDNNITWQECTGVAGPNGDITNTVNWTIVQNTSVSLGQVIKNVAATHYFICSTQGTAGNGAEPSWNTTTGGTTLDNSVTWTCIGAIGSFTGWQYPHNTVMGANSDGWGQDGNTFYIANNHLEIFSTAGATYSIAGGTVTSPRYYICTNKLAAPPQSANVSQTLTTGNNAIFVTGIGGTLQIASGAGDCQYWEGVWFNSSNSNITSKLQFGIGSGSMLTLRNCLLWQQGGPIQLGSNIVSASGKGSSLQILSTQAFNNNVFQGSTTTGIEIQGGQIYMNAGIGVSTTLSAELTGTSVFTANTTNGSAAKVVVQGYSINPSNASKTLVNATNMQVDFSFIDCSFGSNLSGILTGTPLALNGTRVDIINCDSGNTNYRNERYVYAGTGTTERTIVRTGGATDGVTPASRKIVTGTGASWAMPYEDNILAYWNDVIAAPAAKYITLYGVWNGGSVPNNDDIWIEVDYLAASSTKSTRLTTTKANILSVATATDVDSSTWGGGTTPFSISTALFTQVKAGYIYVTVKVGKPSATIYYDPKIALI